MALRQAFVTVAGQEGATIAALCRGSGISRTTGDTWLARAAAGAGALADHSRRPHTSPAQPPAMMEAQIRDVRAAHPSWGGGTRHHRLLATEGADVPAPSTITAILRRHGLLAADPPPRDFIRFEHPAPNALWPLDIMGHRPLSTGGRVHPLTLLDEHSRDHSRDHSRCALGVTACADERHATGTAQRTAAFRHDGLPQAMRTEHGAPWATAGRGGITALEAWLLHLGVAVWHGRSDHPQTRGTVERLHGTIATEVVAHQQLAHLSAAPVHVDACRTGSNPHRLQPRAPA